MSVPFPPHEPHAVLGARPGDNGSLVVWRPCAREVRVVGGGALAPGGDGTFHGPAPDGTSHPALEAVEADGSVVAFRDPYAFPPSIGQLDVHLIGEGRHEDLGEVLGAHVRRVDGVDGIGFAVWAPGAASVALVGDWNGWSAERHPMRSLGGSGVWEIFVPEAAVGDAYKFRIAARDGGVHERADPVAGRCEVPPRTASVVAAPAAHPWADAAWLATERRPWAEPLSVYEVHLPSWRRNPEEGNRSLTYRELAVELVAHVRDLGFTHVELLPVMAHPYSGSWGYQTTGYFSPMPGPGSPDDLRALVDAFHAAGIGVLLDWVPAHFPRDEWALARFDGTALYEHEDPRRGEHPDWGTLVFNHGRTEVRNFLIASAVHWLERFHADGIRVDAVASMIYRDYSRSEGEWLPNADGGREDWEAIAFLRELNAVCHRRRPGVIMAAEESTAWPGVTAAGDEGGLGFGFKWNMGWMHDTLQYFSTDPVHRRHHHDRVTFGLVYAFSEHFILPLSHDEVVHGKGSLLGKMPGDEWQRHANLRALYGHMWAHPGKKLLFMGGELAQVPEWSHEGSVEWHLRDVPLHAGLMRLVADLNRVYRAEPALWQRDRDPTAFAWIVGDDADNNVFAYARHGEPDTAPVVCVANLSPVPRHDYRIGLPRPGAWRERLNTDAVEYGGAGMTNPTFAAEPVPGGPYGWSARLTLPPLAVLWLVPETA